METLLKKTYKKNFTPLYFFKFALQFLFMYRSHNCGELRASHINTEVTLSGWVQKSRDKGFIVWVDLRDRYGITQLVFDEERSPKTILEQAQNLGREFVIQVKGTVN